MFAYAKLGKEQITKSPVQKKEAHVKPTLFKRTITTNKQQNGILSGFSFTKERGVVQGMFTNVNINGNSIKANYVDAALYWANARDRVNAFVDAYAADNGFSNPHLEENMYYKARKADLLCAGESFETHRWRKINANNTYLGPGGEWGADIKEFTNSNHHAATGTAREEIKSSERADWRNLFLGVNLGLHWVAYLGGDALTNAQATQNIAQLGAATGRTITVYNKDDVNLAPFNCLY